MRYEVTLSWYLEPQDDWVEMGDADEVANIVNQAWGDLCEVVNSGNGPSILIVRDEVGYVGAYDLGLLREHLTDSKESETITL